MWNLKIGKEDLIYKTEIETGIREPKYAYQQVKGRWDKLGVGLTYIHY